MISDKVSDNSSTLEGLKQREEPVDPREFAKGVLEECNIIR